MPRSVKRTVLHSGGPLNARVWRVDAPDGTRWIEKDFSENSWPVRQTLGRLLVRRECQVLRRLEGLGGVPAGVRRLSPFALREDFVEGPTLHDLCTKHVPIPREFFDSLAAVVAAVHAAGFVHLDLYNDRNVIVASGGKPVLLDWQSALGTSRLPGFLRRRLEGVDRAGAFKFCDKLRPVELTDSQRRFPGRFRFLRKRFWFPRLHASHSRTRSTTPFSPILCALLLFLAVSALCGLVLGVVSLDLGASDISGLGETSATEFSQALLVTVIAGAFAVAAVRRPDLRGGLVLVAGFFLCMAIRENDAWLDRVHHGFWFPVALAAVAVSLGVAWCNRTTLRAGLGAVCNPRANALLAVGLALLLVFSRIFGSKSFWQAAGIYPAHRIVKTVVEETLELLADALLFLWAVLVLRLLPHRQHGSGNDGHGIERTQSGDSFAARRDSGFPPELAKGTMSLAKELKE